MDIIHYQLSNPPLDGFIGYAQRAQAKWKVGSTSYLCISTKVRNPAFSQWDHNGRILTARTVRANDQCFDCNSERCIRQLEQLHGAQKRRRGAEVLQMTWSDPCDVNSEAIQMLSLLRVNNVSLESTGVFVFQQRFRLIQYNVAVGKWGHMQFTYVAGPSPYFCMHA